MVFNFFSVATALSLLTLAFALPTARNSAPTVSLGHTTFQGFPSANETESFLGIPYAAPP